MKILVINGPNLNMLGKRSSTMYGTMTLVQIQQLLEKKAQEKDVTLIFFQSNHEGEIIDFLQKTSSRTCDGILINPGALTHYGYSLRDALEDTGLPIVEVHLSNILEREAFRKIDVFTGVVIDRVMGRKEQSYIVGLEKLLEILKHEN
jgi:3-dehydroquinate dehydratase II